jgi:hypothetical protein
MRIISGTASVIRPEEVLLMKIMNTEREEDGSDIAGGVHHCSSHLAGTQDEEVRESIETKFIAFLNIQPYE